MMKLRQQTRKPTLQRNFLSFFWDRFEAADGLIIKSTPGLLFDELLKLQQIMMRTPETKNPQLSGDFGTSGEVIIFPLWLRGSDSNRRPIGYTNP